MELNSKEVLKYLQDYGISSINKDDFKHFMKDLKKLIKYEERQKQSLLLNRCDKENVLDTCTQTPVLSDLIHKNNSLCMCDEYTEFNKPGNEAKLYHNLIPRTDSKYVIISVDKENPEYLTNKENSGKSCKCDNRASSSLSTKTVRCQSSRKRRKLPNDPVALYHYYQSIWSKHKLPGENDHADLRREIRQRMISKSHS